MRTPQILTIAFVLVLGAGAASAQQSPWPTFRHDAQHTGRTVYTGASRPEVYWTFVANDGITSSPSIGHNGTIYVGAGGYYNGGGDSSLYAINPDGSLKWQFKTDRGTAHNSAGIFSSPAIADDGTVFVGSLDSYLYAIEDSVTYGKLRWRNKLGNWPVYSSPVISPNGNVYVGGLSFYVYGFEQDGTQIWDYMTGWCVFSSPALAADNTVYCGSKDHHLYALTDAPTDPILEWRYAAGAFYDGHLMDSSPSVADDGTIFIGTDPYGADGIPPVPADTNFFAVNPDGSLKWKLGIPRGIESSPAFGHDGTIYIGSHDSTLWAIEDMGTHPVVKWTFPTGGVVDAPPTVDGDGTIYVGSRDSTLYAINPDGTLKWSFVTQGGIEGSVTINDNGYMYFGSFDGNVYCLGTGAPDVGAVSVVLPDSVKPESEHVPMATFANYRGAPNSFEAVCLIADDSVTQYVDTIQVANLAGGQSTIRSFAPWTVGAGIGVDYEVTITTVLAGDDNYPNDTVIVHAISSETAGCCSGPSVGNVDGSADQLVTMGDLTVLISHLFISLDPLDCDEEGNVDMSPDGLVTMGDLTVMISSLFIDLEPLPACP